MAKSSLKPIVQSAMPYRVQGVPGQSIGTGQSEPSYQVGGLGISPNTGGAPYGGAVGQSAGTGAYDTRPAPTFVQANTDLTGPVQVDTGYQGGGDSQMGDGMHRP